MLNSLRSTAVCGLGVCGLAATLAVGSVGCADRSDAGDVLVGPNGAARTSDTDDVDTSDDVQASERSWLRRVFDQTPQTVLVPEGTRLTVLLGKELSSHSTAVGTAFSAVLAQDVAAAGMVAIPAGSRVYGEVTEAAPAQKIGGRARLSVEFDTLEIADAKTFPISAELVRLGKSERAKDAAIIGGGTVGGAILGEAIDEGEGGVLGAVVGGLAGTAAAKKTKGKPVVLPQGVELELVLAESVEVTAPRARS